MAKAHHNASPLFIWIMMMKKEVTKKDILNFCWSYWRRRKTLGVFSVVFLTLATLMDIFIPLYSGKIIDSMIEYTGGDFQQTISAIIIFITLLFGFSFFRLLSFACYNRYECLSMRDILIDAARKVQSFSSNWHANNFAGGTVRKITRSSRAFETFEDNIILSLYPAALVLFGANIVLYSVLPLVAIYAFVMALIYVGLTVYIALRFLLPRYKISATQDTKIGAVLSDIVTGNPTVKAFGSEEYENYIFSGVAEEWRTKTQTSYIWTTHVDFIRELVRIAMIAGMLAITFHLWINNKASVGDIIVVISTYFLIGGYLREVGRYIDHIQRAISDIEDVVWYWKTDIAVKDKVGAGTLQASNGQVAFNNIDFSYDHQSEAIYQDFSLDIQAGEKIALVGHSGSGKSTFVKLLQRLYDIQKGEIVIDGTNIAGVTQSSLRQAISLVPQDPILFHRSLRDNIAYAKPEASMDEVIDASKRAFAHEFIENLPQGYDTLVGERGIKLSGGERQRVAIARAILSDAPILILDEATSALDSVSEDYIQKALKELMKGRTTITIAHRLSTIKDVDRILVFDKGRVVEEGTHDSLLKNDSSHYKKLYDMQVMGLIE